MTSEVLSPCLDRVEAPSSAVIDMLMGLVVTALW